MPVVTAIKQQQKRATRYSIFIDQRYSFSLTEQQLAEEELAVGRELSGDELVRLQSSSEFGKALDRAYNYLSYRERSTYEVKTYLAGKDYDDLTIKAVIDRLTEQDFLNDLRFTSMWMNDRLQYKHHSVLKLRQELQQKGIARELIDQALEAVSPRKEVEVIVELIKEKNLLQKYSDQNKLKQYLMQKGFRYTNIVAALQMLD